MEKLLLLTIEGMSCMRESEKSTFCEIQINKLPRKGNTMKYFQVFYTIVILFKAITQHFEENRLSFKEWDQRTNEALTLFFFSLPCVIYGWYVLRFGAMKAFSMKSGSVISRWPFRWRSHHIMVFYTINPRFLFAIALSNLTTSSFDTSPLNGYRWQHRCGNKHVFIQNKSVTKMTYSSAIYFHVKEQCTLPAHIDPQVLVGVKLRSSCSPVYLFRVDTRGNQYLSLTGP